MEVSGSKPNDEVDKISVRQVSGRRLIENDSISIGLGPDNYLLGSDNASISTDNTSIAGISRRSKVGSDNASIDDVSSLYFGSDTTSLSSVSALSALGGGVSTPLANNIAEETHVREVSGRRIIGSDEINTPGIPEQIHITHKENVHVVLKQVGSFINASVVIDNTRLAIVNTQHWIAEVVDLNQRKSTSYIKLDSRPWDLTYTGKNQIVVTLPRTRSLVFLDVGQELVEDKRLNIGGVCEAIDYTDNMLVVSFTNPGSVKLLQLDGQVLKSFVTDANGKNIFSGPYFLVTSKDKGTIYVSDIEKNTVTKLDMDGTVKGVYRSASLKGPRGLAVDKYGNVYIAGYDSKNVCILTPGSKQIQPLLKKDWPLSIAIFDDFDQMLVLSHLKSYFSIYKLQ